MLRKIYSRRYLKNALISFPPREAVCKVSISIVSNDSLGYQAKTLITYRLKNPLFLPKKISHDKMSYILVFHGRSWLYFLLRYFRSILSNDLLIAPEDTYSNIRRPISIISPPFMISFKFLFNTPHIFF